MLIAKSQVSKYQWPQELPQGKDADAVIVKDVEVDAEAGRGEAPNNNFPPVISLI